MPPRTCTFVRVFSAGCRGRWRRASCQSGRSSFGGSHVARSRPMRLISLGCAGAGNQAHGHPDRNTLGKREGLGELNLLSASAKSKSMSMFFEKHSVLSKSKLLKNIFYEKQFLENEFYEKSKVKLTLQFNLNPEWVSFVCRKLTESSRFLAQCTFPK